MKPIFIINTLSETVAKKGSKLAAFSDYAQDVFNDHIFDNLDLIVDAGRKSKWVIIEGGDGTAQGIISAFFNQLDNINDMPKFTLLPGGMTNQVSKNIGLKAFSRKGLNQLLTKKRTENKTSLLKISSKDHSDLYGFLFSTGGVPMITTYTKDKLHRRGIGGSTAVLGGIIKGLSGNDDSVLQSTQISLDVDGEILSGSHLGTLVTTLSSLLLGLDPFWGPGTNPLRLTYVEGEPKHLTRHVAGLWLGRKTKDRRLDGLHSYRADKLIYDYDGPVILDGESILIGKQFSISHTQPLTFIS